MGAMIYDLEQGTQEWLSIRSGIPTCSELSKIFSKGRGDKPFGSGAYTYIYELIGEQITGEPRDSFSTANTERGHAHESVAIELYELQNDVSVNSCGFMKNSKIGYSPDGLVGEKGLVEIKSKLPKFQVEILHLSVLPSEHYHQCLGGLYVSDREWIDFVSYCPNLPLFVKRLYRNESEIQELENRIDQFLEELQRVKQKVLSGVFNEPN